MSLDEAALLAACRGIARELLDLPREPAPGEVVPTAAFEAEVARTYEVASALAKLVAEADGDPNLVVRAVDYSAHDLFVLHEDLTFACWEAQLTALVLLACPGLYGFPMPPSQFHADLMAGITKAYSIDDDDDDDGDDDGDDDNDDDEDDDDDSDPDGPIAPPYDPPPPSVPGFKSRIPPQGRRRRRQREDDP